MAETMADKMADASGEPIQLRIRRSFDAPRELVFQAWTDPEHLVNWWGPDGLSVPHCEMDVREGGKFRTCMQEPDGTEHWVQGAYLRVSPHDLLSFTWAWEEDGVAGHTTHVTVEFTDNGDKTDLVLTHSGFETDSSRDGHNGGWTSSFVSLDRALEAALSK